MTGQSTSFLKSHAVRLDDVLHRLGISRAANRKRIVQGINRAYGEPHRVYHNAAHIMDMLDLFDEDWFQDASELKFLHNQYVRDTLEAAIWWHDAVYQLAVQKPGIGNEAASAAWAFTELMQGGTGMQIPYTVHDLVLATDHVHPATATWAPWIIDLDLAILGADEYHFPLYEAHIAAEYSHVPYLDYLGGRAYFLRIFLESRDYIYHTAPFRDRYEERAQDNVKGLIAQLKSHLKEIERHGSDSSNERT